MQRLRANERHKVAYIPWHYALAITSLFWLLPLNNSSHKCISVNVCNHFPFSCFQLFFISVSHRIVKYHCWLVCYSFGTAKEIFDTEWRWVNNKRIYNRIDISNHSCCKKEKNGWDKSVRKPWENSQVGWLSWVV